LEKVPGDVLTQTELFGENGIAFGTFDHVQKAEARETRAIIICDRVHNLPVAACHEHVCDRVLEGFSFRDREQMRLTFGSGVGNQGFGVEPPRLLGSLIDLPGGHREKLRAGWPPPNAGWSAQRCPAQRPWV
jgi:hypothetical protein